MGDGNGLINLEGEETGTTEDDRARRNHDIGLGAVGDDHVRLRGLDADIGGPGRRGGEGDDLRPGHPGCGDLERIKVDLGEVLRSGDRDQAADRLGGRVGDHLRRGGHGEDEPHGDDTNSDDEQRLDVAADVRRRNAEPAQAKDIVATRIPADVFRAAGHGDTDLAGARRE